MSNDTDCFISALTSAGLNPESFSPVIDGNIHRFHDMKLDKTKKLNGWYALHDFNGLIVGAFGHWKTGQKERFSSRQLSTLSKEGRVAVKAMIEAALKRNEEEQARVHAKCRENSDKLWAAAQPANPDHPYLIKKDVGVFGIRQFDTWLYIPVRDTANTLHGLQKIYPDGTKIFLLGSAVAGHYHALGKPNGSILIAEGYATGATLHQITGQAVAVAFNAGNLKPVAEALREKHPDATLIVCADDDHTTDGNPGMTKATEAALAISGLLAVPSFPASRGSEDTDFNDLARLAGPETVKQCIVTARQLKQVTTNQSNSGPVIKTGAAWDAAKEFFPKVDFPREVFPPSLDESLEQLARSHATSATSLPGAAMAILSSVLGRTIEVSPKDSWREPLIFWFGDIRPSGQGKTPAAQALCATLYAAQERADDDYKILYDTWAALPKKDQGPPPARARGYYVTDLTLEGLRNDLSGHGGTICILDELSTFINGQNQYRGGKGGDREAWLKLFDGKPARITRAAGALSIRGSRVNLFGGIQPRVWREVFGGGKSLYLEDGTIYRFLPVFEGEQFHLLTDESWSNTNRHVWETILTRAMEWADAHAQQVGWEAFRLSFDDSARVFFIDWINTVSSYQTKMPEPLRGFFPKLKTYVVRLTGLLHCMAAFDAGITPNSCLNKQDVEMGIKCGLFYMGHIVEALRHLLDATAPAITQITEQGKQIAELLRTISPQKDNGRLAIGFITDRYNELHMGREMTPRAMGSMLRALDLTIPDSRHNANGRTGIYCLEWDNKTDELLNQCPEVHEVQRHNKDKGEMSLNIEIPSPEVQQLPEYAYPFAGLLEHSETMSRGIRAL